MNQPTAEIYGFWLDNQFPYKLYVAQQDNSTIIISSQADPSSAVDWRSGPGCETGPIMPYPRDPNIVYASCKGPNGGINLKKRQDKNYRTGRAAILWALPPRLRYSQSSRSPDACLLPNAPRALS